MSLPNAQEILSSSPTDEVVDLKRSHAVAGKEPMLNMLDDELDSEDPGFPDLADYFRDYHLTYDEQIRICRAYASYLTAQQGPRTKRMKK